MSKKNRQQNADSGEKVLSEQTPNTWKFVIALVGIAIFLGLGYWFFRGVLNNKTIKRQTGIVTGCTKVPTFVSSLGFSNQAALSTSEKRIKGLAIIEQGKQPYQHSSWKAAGFLAPIQLSKNGDIYVAPAPTINVLDNPILEQNTLYKVDGKSQEMKPFAKLPSSEKPTDQNPFGLLGLAYDCETETVYASSIFGSTRTNEAGKIFAVDEKTGSIKSELNNVDAFGIAVYNSAKGKRLYYGLSRLSEVWSIGLQETGDFMSDPRREFSFDGFGPRGDDRARKLRFQPNGELLVSGIEFNFNLIAPTEKQETLYRFRYDGGNDSFSFVPNQ
jgi:hypothetical protein